MKRDKQGMLEAKSKRRRLFGEFVTALLLLGFVCPVATAEFIHPDLISTDVPRYEPLVKNVPKGQYTYDVAWNGIPVASARVQIKEYYLNGKTFLYVEAAAESASVVRLVYTLRHQTESLFRSDSFLPVSFHSYQIENSKEKIHKVSFKDRGSIVAKHWKNGKFREEISFSSDGPVFDPVSGAFLARALPLKVGQVKEFDIFNGKHRYLIAFHVKAIDRLEVNGKEIDAFRVVPKVSKLTDTNGVKKLRSATLWVSADERREIVRLESEVWIGSVTAELSSFSPGNQGPELLTPLQVKLHEKNRTRVLYR